VETVGKVKYVVSALCMRTFFMFWAAGFNG